MGTVIYNLYCDVNHIDHVIAFHSYVIILVGL